MATVTSQYFAGKTINVPHTEHRITEDSKQREKSSVRFNSNGKAQVSATMKAALLTFYPKLVS